MGSLASRECVPCRGGMPPDNGVVDDNYVHARAKKAAQCLLGRIHDWLVLIEARVEQYWYPRKGLKFRDQTVVPRICPGVHGLKATAAVGVSDSWEDITLVRPHWIDLLHERVGRRVDEVIVHRVFEN